MYRKTDMSSMWFQASETVAILYKLSNDNIDENLREQVNYRRKILYYVSIILGDPYLVFTLLRI